MTTAASPEQTPQRGAAIEAFNVGVRAMLAGETEQAVSSWEQCVHLDRTIAPALHNLIVYLETRGDWARVASLYADLLALDPYDTRSRVRRASALRRLGRLTDAVEEYERAIAVYPYCRHWYIELAMLLEAAQKPQDAQTWRNRAAALGTDEAEMALEDGARLQRENESLAIACFEAVLEEFPANIDARLRLARLLARTGENDRALAHYDQALELTDSAPALVLYHRARLLAQLGRNDESMRDATLALEHDPAFGRAQELLWALRGASAPAPAASSSTAAAVLDGATTGIAALSNADVRTAGRPQAQTSRNASLVGHSRPGMESGSLSAIGDMRAPWEDAVLALLRHWATTPGPRGRPPRVALLLERNRLYAPAAARLLRLLNDPMLPPLPDGSQPVFVVEGPGAQATNPVHAAGWLGSAGYEEPRYTAWDVPIAPIALDAMLGTLLDAGGQDGFNLVLLLGSGQAQTRGAELARTVQAIPSFQYALLTGATGATEVARLLQPVAPAWLDVAVDV